MTKQNQQQIDQSFEFAQKALLDLKQETIPAWPEMYEVLYSSLSGQDRMVSQALDKAREAHGELNTELLMDVHERFFGCDRAMAVSEEIGGKISDEIRKILLSMKAAGERSGKFDEALKKIDGRFGEITTPEQLHGVVKVLSELTSSIASNNQNLTSRLNRSADQINVLHHDLQKARNESNTDALTGLANRKKFDVTIKRALQHYKDSGEPLSFIICDIDHFKRFNDQYGHQTGDQVLRLVSHTLKTCLKGRDTPARYGGEEFGIILPRTRQNDAMKVAEQIREAAQAKELVKRSTGENLGRITISLGVTEASMNDSVTSLVERADMAMYSAKEQGRNRSVLAPGNVGANANAQTAELAQSA